MVKKKYDSTLFIMVLLLCAFGIVSVFSASTEIANSYYGNRMHFLYRQLIWFFIGLFCLIGFMKIPLELIRGLSRPAIFISMFMLVLVLIVGVEVKGGTRWFNLGFMRLQPSSLAQVAVILFVSDYLYRKQDDLDDFKRLIPLMGIVGVIALFIALQPDFSTAFMLALTAFLIVVISNVSFRNIGVLSLAGIGVALPVLLVKSYRINRISAWLQSWISDQPVQSLEVNYQAKQSLISFGVGGFSGVGLGQSKQKFFFLPEAHTDYILAIIGEEMGFIGAVTVITLFFIIIWRGVKIANQTKHLFQYYLAAGLTFYLGTYAFINAMIVLNLLPSTGLPMPFVSYGGTQLLVSMMCIGLLLNISSQNNKEVEIAEQEDYLGVYEQTVYE